MDYISLMEKHTHTQLMMVLSRKQGQVYGYLRGKQVGEYLCQIIIIVIITYGLQTYIFNMQKLFARVSRLYGVL